MKSVCYVGLVACFSERFVNVVVVVFVRCRKVGAIVIATPVPGSGGRARGGVIRRC